MAGTNATAQGATADGPSAKKRDTNPSHDETEEQFEDDAEVNVDDDVTNPLNNGNVSQRYKNKRRKEKRKEKETEALDRRKSDVRFIIGGSSNAPRKDDAFPDTRRRRLAFRRFLLSKYTGSVTIDVDTDEEIPALLTVEDYNTLKKEVLAHVQPDTWSNDDLNEEFHTRMEYRNSYSHDKDDEPYFPFTIALDSSKEVGLAYQGTCTYLDFMGLLEKNSYQMFLEMRNRSIALDLIENMLVETNTDARVLALNIHRIFQRTDELAQSLESHETSRASKDKVTDTNPPDGSDGSSSSSDSDDDEDDDDHDPKKNKKNDQKDLMRTIEDKEREIQHLKALICQGSPASTTTISRAGKLKDVPAWHNEEKKDEIKFPSWLRRITNKLNVNADLYPDDEAKFAYIKSRIKGKAIAALEPYVDGTHPAQLTTSSELLEHLRDMYEDPDKRRTARTAFKSLVYEMSDDFGEFKSDFVRLAGASGKVHDEWKEEFRDRLPVTLQLQLVTSFVDNNVNFKEYVKRATEFVVTVKQAYATRQEKKKEAERKEKGKDGKRRDRKKDKDGKKDEKDKDKSSSSGGKKKDYDELRKRALCYDCEGSGHMRGDPECPKSKDKTTTVSEVDDSADTKKKKDKKKVRFPDDSGESD